MALPEVHQYYDESEGKIKQYIESNDLRLKGLDLSGGSLKLLSLENARLILMECVKEYCAEKGYQYSQTNDSVTISNIDVSGNPLKEIMDHMLKSKVEKVNTFNEGVSYSTENIRFTSIQVNEKQQQIVLVY